MQFRRGDLAINTGDLGIPRSQWGFFLPFKLKALLSMSFPGVYHTWVLFLLLGSWEEIVPNILLSGKPN
jgi:hypothetical protein